jgi:hypothetical protein
VEHAICRDTGVLPAGLSTDSRVAACKGLLDRYRPLANTHPGERPLAVLALASDDNAGMLQKAPGVPFFVLSRSEGSAGPEKAAFTVEVWKGELENAGVEATS